MLDAGHGGRDPGAVYNGRQEKIDTLSLTLATDRFCRSGESMFSIHARQIFTSRLIKRQWKQMKPESIFSSLSIVILFRKITLSRESNLLSTTNPALNWRWPEKYKRTTWGDRFCKSRSKSPPRARCPPTHKMPAVLVEVGFINSDTDNMLFDDNFSDIALAIAEGILDTLGINTPVVPLPEKMKLRSLRCLMKTHILMMPFLMKTTFLSFLFHLATQFKQAHFVIPCMPNDSAGSCPNLTFLPLSSRETDYTESW